MEDLISRQEAIEAVDRACFELRGVFGRCKAEIMNLPSVQQWIPINERLPPVGEVVLWCNKHGSVFTSTITYKDADEHFRVGRHGWDWDMVSWMPLPNPYQG